MVSLTGCRYCTGGIRCEMASAYIKSKGAGFENVFQVKPEFFFSLPTPFENKIRNLDRYAMEMYYVHKVFILSQLITL